MAESGELYDTDILVWSEQQAALLRRVAAGERVNNRDLDWPNIIDEVESVGLSELHAVESLLLQALIHMLKAEAWPDSIDGQPPQPVPQSCPLTLQELLAEGQQPR